MIKRLDSKLLFAVAMAVILALPVSVQAASRWWDGGMSDIGGIGNSASAGGDGTWNTTITNWDAGAVAHTNWVNANNDAAFFAGTAGTVTLGGVTVGGLQFDAAEYTLTASTLTFGTSGNIVANQNATINSAIAATGLTITKTGSGTLTLGGNNTYAGATTISVGTLKAGSSTGFSSSSTFNVNGGFLDLNGFNATVASLGAGNSAGTITNSAAGIGTNTLTVNNFTVGLASLIADGATAKTALVVTDGGATPKFVNANNTFSGGLTIATNASSNTRIYQDTVSTTTNGDGTIQKSTFGKGTINIGSAGSAVNAQLVITSANQLIYNPIVFNAAGFADGGKAAIRADGGGLLLYGQLTAGASDINISAQASSAVTAFGQLTSSGANGLTLKTPGNGTGTLTLTLSNTTANANNYQGNTTLQTLTTLVLGKNDQIPNGASTGNMTDNGAFNLGGFNETINGLSGAGVVDGVSGTPTLTVGDNNATGAANTFSGVIKNTAGTLSLTKIGTGTLTLSGTNSFTGVIAINTSGGTLQIGGAGQLGSGSYATNIAIGSSATFDYGSSANQTLSGVISGAGALNKSGSGILTLSGSNTYFGATTISVGSLMAGSAMAISTNSALTVSSTGVFDLNGFNATVASVGAGSLTAMITNSAAGSGTNTLTINRLNVSLASLITDGATAKTALVVTDLADTPKFVNANNTFSGGLTLAANATANTRIYQDNVSTTTNGDGSIQKSTFGKGTINIGSAGSAVNAQLVITSANQLIYNPIVFNAAGYADGGKAAIRADGGGLQLYGQLTAGASDINISAQASSAVTAFGQLTSSGANGLTVKTPGNGTGTLTLTLSNTTANANNYQGNTTLQTLTTLVLGKNDQIPNGASAGNVTNNGTFNLGGFSETINGLSGTGAVDGVSGTPTLTVGDNNASGAANTFSGVIKGPLALTKVGNGTLTLSGTNTYSGLTTVSAGELVGVTGGSCSNSIVTVAAGATNGVSILAANGQWVCAGLTNSVGYLDINYGAIGLSSTTAPLQVNGPLDLSGSLTIIVRSTTGIGIGQYPLVKYTGSLSGTPPTTVTLPAGVSGSISNNTANSSIDLVVTTPSAVYWAVGSGNWNINSSLNWKDTPSAGVTNAYYVDGEAVTFDDSAIGSSPILVTNAVAVSPASVVVSNVTKNYQISGSAIAGNVTLTKFGTGTLTLSGTNTFVGAIQVNGGILELANTNAKPAGVTATTSAAGSIGLGVGAASGDYSDANVAALFNTTLSGFNLAAGSAVALDTTAGNFTQAGGLTAARSLTKLGGNTLTLSGINTYSGTTTISAGTLKAGSTTGLSSNSAFSVAAGAILDLGGFDNIISNLAVDTATSVITNSTGSATLRIRTALSNTACAQLFAGSLGLQIFGGSTVNSILGNVNNTHSGGTILGDGTGITFTRVFAGSGTLGSGSPGAVTSGLFGRGPITFGASTADKSEIYFNTTVTINNALVVNSAQGFGISPDFGAFRVESTGSVLAGTINANLADAIFTTQNAGKTLSVSGAISGNSGLRVWVLNNGSLTITLNNTGTANSYLGNTIISSTNVSSPTATLTLGAAEQIPNGIGKGNLVITNGAFNLGGYSETINGLSGSGVVDGVSGTPTLTVGDNDATGAANTFAGVIKGPLALTKIGNGTLTLSGTNTYSGNTTINTGKVQFVIGGSCSNSTVILANSTATNSVSVTDNNKNWTCSNLTASAAGVMEFNFGANTPSIALSPLNIIGLAAFTATPTVSVLVNSGLTPGTYPLMTWGSTSGTIPTTANLTVSTLAGGTTASLSVSGGNTLNLVIATSGFNWDNNGLTSGFGTAAGTWAASTDGNASQGWSTDGTGNTLPTTVSTSTNDPVNFGNGSVGLGSGTITVSGSVSNGSMTFASGSGEITLSGGTINFPAAAIITVNNSSNTISSVMAGAATSLTKAGAGMLMLSGTNTYSGATTISNGTLKAGSATGLSSNSAFSVVAGATLDLGGFTNSISSLATNTTGIITNSTSVAMLRISTAMGSIVNSNLFTGNLCLQIYGGGTLNTILGNANNTYSGGTILGNGLGTGATRWLSSGTIGNGSPGAVSSGFFGTGPITIGASTTDKSQIYCSGVVIINNAIVVNTILGDVDFGAFRLEPGSLTINGTINANLADVGFWANNGTGNRAATVTNTIFGNSGLQVLASSSALITVILANTGTANSYAGNTTIGSANATLTLGAANQIPNGTDKGNLIVTGGTFSMGGFSETINGLSGSGTVDGVSGTPILTVGDNNATGVSNTYSGVIKGPLALSKIGTGTMILSGTNTYSGSTTINTGKLQFVVGGSCSNSTVILAATTATNSVSVTVNTLSWTCSNLTANAAGVMEFSFGNVTPSLTVSPLNIRSNATFTVTPAVSVLVSSGLALGTYPLMTWGASSGTVPMTANLTVSTLAGGTAASLSVTGGNTLNLVIVEVIGSVYKIR